MAARPDSLRAVRRTGSVVDSELQRVAGGLRAALGTAGAGRRSAGVPAWAESLAHDLATLAASWDALDGWVGRIGDAVERADAAGWGVATAPPLIGPPAPVVGGPVVRVPQAALAGVGGRPTWVDGLSDAEASTEALRLAKRLAPFADRITGEERDRLRAHFWPLVRRLRERWPSAVLSAPSSPSVCASPPPRPPDGLEDAIDVLHLAGPGRVPHTAGVVEAFWGGFVAGELSSSYDNLGGEVARTAGHVASGVLAFGDVRDALVEGSRDNWAGVALALGGLIPAAGDAAKGAKALDDVVEAATDLRAVPRFRIDLAEHGSLGGHALDHVQRSEADLRARVARQREAGDPISGASSFSDRATAEAAIERALSDRMVYVDRVTAGGQAKTSFTYDVGNQIGWIYPEIGPPLATTRITVVLRADPASASGFRVQTAFPSR